MYKVKRFSLSTRNKIGLGVSIAAPIAGAIAGGIKGYRRKDTFNASKELENTKEDIKDLRKSIQYNKKVIKTGVDDGYILKPGDKDLYKDGLAYDKSTLRDIIHIKKILESDPESLRPEFSRTKNTLRGTLNGLAVGSLASLASGKFILKK